MERLHLCGAGCAAVRAASRRSAFTGDGAYDRQDVYGAVAERHPEAAVIVPPRKGAVPSEAAEAAPTQRDRHLRSIAEQGRMGWQKASGYDRRALAEAAVSRFKVWLAAGGEIPL